MNQSPFKILRLPYGTATFKTNTLHLISKEGQVKFLLLLYKWLIRSYLSLLWLYLAFHFIISTHMTYPLLKLKRSLLLAMRAGKTSFAVIYLDNTMSFAAIYPDNIQHYLSLLWL